jgi:hypothetical protein
MATFKVIKPTKVTAWNEQGFLLKCPVVAYLEREEVPCVPGYPPPTTGQYALLSVPDTNLLFVGTRIGGTRRPWWIISSRNGGAHERLIAQVIAEHPKRVHDSPVLEAHYRVAQ